MGWTLEGTKCVVGMPDVLDRQDTAANWACVVGDCYDQDINQDHSPYFCACSLPSMTVGKLEA